nr:recombinase family protein [Lactiplantibacillus plantarum]
MTKLNKPKVIGYTRVSTRRQALQGFSLSSQRQGIQKYAEIYDLALQIFEDAGISGATMQRPALQNVLNYIRFDVGVKCLVVSRLDRLSRNATDMIQIAELCQDHGVQLVSLNEHLSGDPNSAKSQVAIYGAVAEFQRSIIRENVMLGSARRFKAGLPLSMKFPIGYKLGPDGHVMTDLIPALLVIEMFDRYIDGVGYRKLADWLSGKLRRHISLVTISTMLDNKHYIGLSENIYGTSSEIYLAIIDESTFMAAQKRRAQQALTKVHTSRKDDLLYQKLKCPICEHHLGVNVVTKNGHQYCYYYCSMGKNIADKAQRHTFRMRAPETRSVFLDSIRSVVSDPGFISILRSALDARLATLPAQATLRQPASSTQLYKQFEAGDINASELREGLSELKRFKARQVTPSNERFSKALQKFQQMGLVMFIKRVIESVLFDKDKQIVAIEPKSD